MRLSAGAIRLRRFSYGRSSSHGLFFEWLLVTIHVPGAAIRPGYRWGVMAEANGNGTRKTSEAGEVDELDQQIIDLLRANGRASNQEVARALGVTAATVGARIRRMEEENLMRVVAVTDFAAAGYELLLTIGVQVQHVPAVKVAQSLAVLPEVFSCNLVTGDQDIEILVAAQDMDSLKVLLSEKLPDIEGIRALEPSLAIDVLKYESGMVPLR